jgi:hypothetical protein
MVDETALIKARTPQSVIRPPAVPAGKASSYGLGWNVGTDAAGRPTVNHSGAFALGAATNVSLLPSEDLAVITLTNAAPVGAAETPALSFFDYATYGRLTVDWEPFLAAAFASMGEEGDPAATAGPEQDAAARRRTPARTRTHYGPITIFENGGLVMHAGRGP